MSREHEQDQGQWPPGPQSSAGAMVRWRENEDQQDPGSDAVDAWLREIGLASPASFDLVGSWLRDSFYHIDFPAALLHLREEHISVAALRKWAPLV